METSPPSRLPSQDRSPSLTLLSLFLFCPTSFRREWAAFLGAWCPPPAFRSCFVEVAQHSNDLSMNLWERRWSPCPIPPPYWDRPQPEVFIHRITHYSNIWKPKRYDTLYPIFCKVSFRRVHLETKDLEIDSSKTACGACFPVLETELPLQRGSRLISGQKDSLKKEMATHSGILAWNIPRTEEPGRLQSTGQQRVG